MELVFLFCVAVVLLFTIIITDRTREKENINIVFHTAMISFFSIAFFCAMVRIAKLLF
jgi:hypothetical protein